MPDWERVERLRRKGLAWDLIAADPRVDFTPEPGSDPGRSLRVLYNVRKSKLGSARGDPRAPGEPGPRLSARRRFPSRTWIPLVAIAVIVAVVLGYLALSLPPGGTSSGANGVVTYCGGEGSAAHYHVLLIIEDNGVQQPLPYDPSQPADIGYVDQPGFTNGAYYCPSGGIHALHTHDGSGILHAELPAQVVNSSHAPTLGDFFAIWGEPLTPGTVWNFHGAVKATLYDGDTQRSTDYSNDPGDLPLYYPPGGPGSNPYSIPQNLIFHGQFGTGESGGTFDGEIIWLNVTSTSAAVGPGGPLPAAPGPAPVPPSGPFRPSTPIPDRTEAGPSIRS